jgi:uncharacterized surface protein with fasciclin (FAS1) repeats
MYRFFLAHRKAWVQRVAMRTFLTCLAVLTCSSLPGALASPASAAHQPTIAEVASGDPRFSTLLAAAKAADLVPVLAGKGPMTLFAPTNDAFASLPAGTVEALLRPEKRDALMRLLMHHVVAGKVLAGDVLKVQHAATLEGSAVRFGLTVGGANVIQPDVVCSNGVIHVIDRVLLPPEPGPQDAPGAVGSSLHASHVVRTAIDRGAPVYNSGDHAACAAIYAEAARALLATPGALCELHVDDVGRALAAAHEGPGKHAWALRRAFDRVIADEEFQVRLEAPLPAGFPGPGPVGRVVTKEYPAYRAARAAGGERSFWTLFQHIQSHDVKMTAPVEMTLDDELKSVDMAFLYERPEQGASGMQGRVAVLDLHALRVLSIGLRGERDEVSLRLARRLLEERMAKDGLEPAGSHRVLGYNSPMVPASQRFWELQVPVRAR